MKIGRIALLLSIICCLFLASISSVSAIDETKTITDAEDDVATINLITYEEVLTDQRPNVDITRVIYSRTGIIATLTLEVKGKIEDKGSLESEDSLVSYAIMISTLEGDTYSDYYITYLNRTCQLDYGGVGEIVNITDFSVDGRTLTLSFNLTSENEIYDSTYALSLDYDLLAGEFYSDEASDIPLEVGAIVPDEALVGEEVTFYGSAIGGVSPYTWHWDFGDGATSTEQYSSHNYSSAGEFNVVLTVTDTDGTQETSTVTITIIDENDDNGEENGEDSNVMVFATLVIIIIIVGIAAVAIILRR